MNSTYQNSLRDYGKTLITHIGLVNQAGTELAGGSPAYARKSVTWTNDGDGVMRPNANIVFDVPASTTVGGWRGYSAVSGGTDYGGSDLTQETYANQGTYTLIAASTGISHTLP